MFFFLFFRSSLTFLYSNSFSRLYCYCKILEWVYHGSDMISKQFESGSVFDLQDNVSLSDGISSRCNKYVGHSTPPSPSFSARAPVVSHLSHFPVSNIHMHTVSQIYINFIAMTLFSNLVWKKGSKCISSAFHLIILTKLYQINAEYIYYLFRVSVKSEYNQIYTHNLLK